MVAEEVKEMTTIKRICLRLKMFCHKYHVVWVFISLLTFIDCMSDFSYAVEIPKFNFQMQVIFSISIYLSLIMGMGITIKLTNDEVAPCSKFYMFFKTFVAYYTGNFDLLVKDMNLQSD